MTRNNKIILFVFETIIVILLGFTLIYSYIWWKDKKNNDPEFSKPIKETHLLIGVRIEEDSFNVYRVEYFEGLKKESVLITRPIKSENR